MFWPVIIVLMASWVVGWFYWPREKRDLLTVGITSAVIAGVVVAGIYLTQWWPLRHHIIENRTVITRYKEPPKVVYKDKIVYRDPKGWYQAVDVAGACKGDRALKIQKMLVNGSEASDDKKQDDQRTYVLAEVLGTGVTITCSIPGDLDGFWSVGQVIVTTKGTPY